MIHAKHKTKHDAKRKPRASGDDPPVCDAVAAALT